MAALLSTKLSPPYARARLIARPRLLQQLSQAELRKVTLLTAPAGYGKSVVMVQLAAAVKYRLVWYQLDEYDNDPTVFLHHLVLGIRRHFPDFGQEALALISQGDAKARLRLLVTAIANGLEEVSGEGMMIALDDYHLVTEPVVHGFVQDLLEHLPAGVHVVIASRTAPPLALSRLILSGEVCSIGAAELRFSRQEIGAFLAREGKELSAETLEELERRTAGWPAALRLLEDAAPGTAMLADISSPRIYDYLASEVFDRQPENVRRFLVATSVLEELTAAFCNKLLDRTDSGKILAYLEKQQLFLIPLTGAEKAYRYHHLFREFLRDRLGAERAVLLRRAGQLSRQAGELGSAMEYLTAAGAHADALAVIRAAGNQAFSRGHWRTVARWLEPLPEESLAADPWLGLYKAKIEAFRGRMGEAESWVNTAAVLFAASGEQAGLAESRMLQARFLRCRGRCAEGLAIMEEVGQLLSGQDSLLRFDLLMEKCLCLGMQGRFADAETILTSAMEVAKRAGDYYAMANLLSGLGNFYWTLGRYPQALQVYQQAAELSPDRLLPCYYMQDFTAVIYVDWGEVELARDYSKRSIAVKENLGLTETLPSAYLQLAYIYCERGEWALAEEYYNKAICLIRENNGERFYLALNLVFLADCLGRQGKWIEARARVEEALAEVPEQPGISWYVWAFEVFVHTDGIREGQEYLTAAIAELEQTGYQRGLCFAYAFQAWLYFQCEDPAAAAEYGEKALALAARLNFQQLFAGRYAALQPILKFGLETGVEVTFVQRVIVRLGERALSLLVELAGHVDPGVRRRMIAPLTEIGGPRARETIFRLTQDPDQEVARMARLAGQGLHEAAGAGRRNDTSLRLVTFGPFRLMPQGKEDVTVNWRSGKARDLLAYLAHHQEPLIKEKILADLWPDSDQESAAVIFHTTLYRLRHVLAKAGYPQLIAYNGKRYQLRLDGFATDRQQFQKLLTAGLSSETAPDQSAGYLEEAVSLYRGDYLADMDYPWLVPFQENLRHAHAVARLRLARYYLSTRDHDRAIAHLKIVELSEPFAEEVHGLIMTAYAGQGNILAVKKQYQKMESTLRKELGLAPSRTICDLYKTLVG